MFSWKNRRRIKYAVNTHGERCYLKSDSLIERAGTAFSDVCVAQDSGLYVGPSIFRCAPINDVLVLMKKIVITRDAGETLDVFMEKPQQSLTSIQKEKLAKAILKQYLLQIYDAGLVHTDIKLTNICIKENRSSAEEPFIISFIDFDESFAVQNPRDTGCGTAGYMAPEFFNTYEDYTRQLDSRGISEAAYARTLRSDYGKLFSRASDVFALGTVCLAYDLLPVHSELFVLVQNMRKQAPEDRPSGDELREALGLAPRLDETMRLMCG
ncbi:MAG: hypothetical protein P1U32_09025 [Legionellaceae bacterium]|nr:hypothetical protein [Legionellaceae bacterium]